MTETALIASLLDAREIWGEQLLARKTWLLPGGWWSRLKEVDRRTAGWRIAGRWHFLSRWHSQDCLLLSVDFLKYAPKKHMEKWETPSLPKKGNLIWFEGHMWKRKRDSFGTRKPGLTRCDYEEWEMERIHFSGHLVEIWLARLEIEARQSLTIKLPRAAWKIKG